MSINALAQGRRFRDAVADGQRFRLRFMDGFEIVCAWGDKGPEAVAYAQGLLTADMDMHPQFRHVCGKTVAQVLTDGEKLLIEFTDGHTLRSSFRSSSPQVEGVDVKVKLKFPALYGAAGSL